MPQRRQNSMVRTLTSFILGVLIFPSVCSTRRHSMPRQPKSAARASPTGPPPTINMGVSRTGIIRLLGGLFDLQHGDRAAGRPCRYGLIREQRSACAARSSGDGDPGTDLVSARPRLRLKLLFRIAQETLDRAAEERIEKAPVEIDANLSRFRHRRPMRETAGRKQCNPLRPAIDGTPDCNAERVATMKRRPNTRKTIDDDRYHGQFGSKQMQREHHAVIEYHFLRGREVYVFGDTFGKRAGEPGISSDVAALDLDELP